jgi:nucleoredoxin
MRLWLYLIFSLLVLATQAGQLALTVNDISLMLRTGYSSSSLMQELAVRHFADTIDEEKETTLLKAGASADLMAALKNRTYSLSAEQTAVVQQQIADQNKRRAEATQAAQKLDAAYQAQLLRDRASKDAKPEIAGESMSQFLKGDLVQWRNGAVVHADDAALADKKLIAFYFSAHWCGPCRKFTPQLVDYYNRVALQHPEFEIVFYSYDKSPSAFEAYMRETDMPWLAIDYSKLKGKEVLAKNAGNGIPSLVLVDSTGKLISSSYSGSQYLGPKKVLADLDAIFSGKPSPRVAATQ